MYATSAVTALLRKQYAIVSIYLSEIFAYRAAAIIWVLGDLQLTLLMPLVWTAAGGIHGYSTSEMFTYYLLAMLVSQVVTCHLLWDIGFEIREGVFVTTLLKPIGIMSYCFARNISWRFGKLLLFLPFLLVLLPLYGFQSLSIVNLSPSFWLALVLGQTLAFFFAFALSMVAFWTTEFISIFEIYYMPEIFFSGRLVPLSALPTWVSNIANMSHFRYTVSFPVEIATGKLSETQIAQGFFVQSMWLIVGYFLCRILLTRGLKHYSGFGS